MSAPTLQANPEPAAFKRWFEINHWRTLMLATGLGVALIALLAVGIGSVYIPPLTASKILLARIPFLSVPVDWSPTFDTILFDIRLPRVVLIALTGFALATAGTAYQGLFRNPLADPYLIGVAAGASLGSTFAVTMTSASANLFGALIIPLGAFAGALAAVALVLMLGRVGQRVPTTTLILAGVAISSFAVSLNTYIMLSHGQQVSRVLAFLLGGYGGAGWDAVTAVVPFVAIGSAVMYLYAHRLNILLFDEEQAQQLGIAVARVKLIIILAATLTTAAVVAFAGLIGFVGLIAPHAARFFTGPDHRRLFPVAALGGAGFLMLADLLARTVIAPQELPLGVLTAFAGVPFFLFLLKRAKNAAFF